LEKSTGVRRFSLARAGTRVHITDMTTTQITLSAPNGMTLSYGPKADARITKVFDDAILGVAIFCRSNKAASEIRSELEAWGIDISPLLVMAG